MIPSKIRPFFISSSHTTHRPAILIFPIDTFILVNRPQINHPTLVEQMLISNISTYQHFTLIILTYISTEIIRTIFKEFQ